MRSRFDPLREGRFRLLFASRGIAFFGNAVASVALAFAVLELSDSKTDLGIVLAARSLPLLVFLIVGGIWANRLPRTHVMVWSNVLSGLTQAAVATLVVTGVAEVWHLIALAALNGTGTAFFFPASAAVVPATVRAELLQPANALLRLAQNGSLVTGAAVAGFLVAAFGPGWALAVDAGTFLIAAALTAAIKLPRSAGRSDGSFITELTDGWSEFSSRTWLWGIVAQSSLVVAASHGAFSVLGPVVADSDLDGPKSWGLILTAQFAGLVAGGLFMLRYRPRRMLVAADLAILMLAAPSAALAASAPIPVILAAAFAGGVGIEIFSVLWDTSIQQEIRPDRLSRVYSYDALGSLLLQPAGLALAGPLAEALGVQTALWGAAGVVAGATVAVLAVREVRLLERRRPP